MARLSVNLNKIALLRNSRHTGVPDVLQFARIAKDSGALGITIHPRPDERHIRQSDVPALVEVMKEWRPQIELNIEGYPDARYLKMVAKIKPEQCTLVPDSPSSFTSEEGWKFTPKQEKLLRSAVASLKKMGTRVILFIDPDPKRVKDVVRMGADGIEIYTGAYAAAFRKDKHLSILKECADTAKQADKLGLCVNVGHDLNLQNLPLLISRIPCLHEASIGHELTADALKTGFGPTVTAYSDLLKSNSYALIDATPRVHTDPVEFFREWFNEAKGYRLPKAEAMTLATATKKGAPTARVVFLKEFSSDGFVFFTNYKSKKGRDLTENPQAALLFHWPELERQVRITGSVRAVSRAHSEEYFATRSRESQISAMASEQSAVILDRSILDARVAELKIKFKDKTIPLPDNWGGYELVPETYEFWEGGAGRSHDRIRYTRKAQNWRTDTLSP